MYAADQLLEQPLKLMPADTLEAMEQEETEEAETLEEVFAILRQAWNIPLDIKLDVPFTEVQKAMAYGVPENWASREIMGLREE